MIFFLPGMGADRAMYGGPWRDAFPAARFLDWPAFQGESSIAALASRIADGQRFQPGDWLVGSSLGGMVAAEIAKRQAFVGVILIGSALHPDEIRPFFRRSHRLLARLPLRLIRRGAALIPNGIAQMFARSDPRFSRALGRAIFAWDGAGAVRPALRLHGRRDPIITRARVVDRWLDAGHLLAITRASACAALVVKATSSSASSLPRT